MVIYVNDHPPAHVHVIGDGEVKINLLGPMAGLSRFDDGMNRDEVRPAVRVVVEQQAFLLACWEEIDRRLSDTEIDAALERCRDQVRAMLGRGM